MGSITPPCYDNFPRNPSNALFYGADYNPEQWERSVWDEDILLMKKAGVNVVSIGIFSWALIETSDDVWDFTWLDDIINLLHRSSICVDLGTATASPPPWLTTAYPEILPINKNGETLYPGSRQQWRPTSPVFRRYALRLVTKLAERYGTHPAVVAWHVNNELGCAHSHDYSEDAAGSFRTWLGKRFGSIDELNAAWGTAFWSQRYNTFEEVLPPRQTPTFINPTHNLDWYRFSSDVLNDYLQAERDILHRFSPGIPVTTNFMLAGQTKNMDVANWQVDFVSNDHYRTPARLNDRDELSFSASLTSAVAGGKPWWLMEHSTSALNWQPVNVAKKKGETVRDSLAHVAHGADAVCYFQWRQSKSGAEKFHSSMVPHAGPDSRLFREICQLGEHLKALKEIKGSKKLPADIAILWDWDSWVASELDGRPSSLIDYFREALDWFVALLDLGYRVDIIPSQGDIRDYRVVIGPILYLVKEEVQRKIHDYVSNGGHFITTYYSGLVDVNDHVRLGGYPGAFRDILGIRVEEWSPLFADEDVKLDDGTVGSVWSEHVDLVGKNIKVIRQYGEGELAGLPAVTRNSFRSGSASYVSTRLGAGLVNVIPALLEGSGVESTLPESLRGLVEQVIRVKGDISWVFLINRLDRKVSLKGVKGSLVMASGDGDATNLASRGIAVFRVD